MFGRYESFSNFLVGVDRHIADRNLNDALRLIQRMVEATIAEPALVGVFLGSRGLDERCRLIGMLADEALRPMTTGQADDTDAGGDIVYIITKLQVSGGHTKVIRDFIKARAHQQHVILSTELLGPSDLTAVNSDLAGGSNIRFEAALGATHFERLQWLLSRVRAIAPKKLYLFNHHQDSVAVAAAVCRSDIPVTFYHHGDHHLSLGVFLPGAEHIDPHPMGYCNCRKKLKIDNRYIPLTVEDQRVTRSDFMGAGFLTTCTAARLNKIELPYYVSYTDLIPELLSKTGGRHVHIGYLTPWARHRIRRGLKRRRVDPRRFEYVPWVPSVWKTLVEKGVDLYIASFPYGGGLTLIEAIGAGVPVALHRHMYSPILSGLSLGYPGAFNWHHQDDLIKFCTTRDPQSLMREGVYARRHYERYHLAEILAGCLSDDGVRPPVPDVSVDAQVQFDVEEWAQWTRYSTSVQGAISKRVMEKIKIARNLTVVTLQNMRGISKGRRS